MDWKLLPVARLYAKVRAYCSHVNRDLRIRQRRRHWKCSWKLDFVSFETFAPLYQVTQLLESRKLRLEMKRRNRVRVQRESKIYRLAVSVLKSTQNSVTSPRSCAGTAKECTKKCDARAELLFNLLIRRIVFRRSRCCPRRTFVRSLIYILRARLLSSHPWLLLPSSSY